ncbi:hypothetical protein [Kordia sp.]|uniref:hypothetical protein n=1 Tax=Kordia sp. TaxID=1965332 RepID=UPI003B5BF45C
MRNTNFIYLMFVSVMFFNACDTKNQKPKNNDSSISKEFYFGQKPPNLIPEIFAPGIVSINGRFEGAVSFSPDLREIYFGAYYEGKETAIYYSKLEKGTWTTIKRANFTKGQKKEEMHPFVSQNSKRIYFTALDSVFADEKIWYVNRLQDSWSAAIQLNSPINDDLVFSANQAKNGDMYYFNLSKFKTYYAPNENGEFSEKMEIGITFGHHAFISPSQDYVLVAGENQENNHRKDNDIYVYFKKQDGTWTKPIHLGNSVNSDFDEKSPRISPDGKYIFFGRSERKGEKGLANIYWVSTEVIHKLKPTNL